MLIWGTVTAILTLLCLSESFRRSRKKKTETIDDGEAHEDRDPPSLPIAKPGTRKPELLTRYLCPVTPKESDPITMADIAFFYMRAFVSLKRPLRLIPSQRAVTLNDPDSRWYQFGQHFVVPIDADFINVVCGDGDDLMRLFTLGVNNVAITAIFGDPNDVDVVVLKQYNIVLCPFLKDVVYLKELGVNVRHVQPENVMELSRVFNEIKEKR